jgi:hypothetical protein
MAKKLWQVWTENDKESAKQGCIVDEKTLFIGTENECRKYAKTIPNAHVGYDCNTMFMPERGDVWQGTIAEDVILNILYVSKKKNTVTAKIVESDYPYPGDDKRKMSYFLDSFNYYYKLVA